MNRIIASLYVIALLALATPATAQVKVYVESTAEDSVGGRLAYAIRERIRRSSSMEIADREKDGFIGVHIVTLDPDANNANQGTRTIYSLVWTTKTFHQTPVTMYLGNSVGLCGSRRVDECGDDLVADTDRWLSRVKGWVLDAVDAAGE